MLAYIGLGSNLADPQQQVRTAINDISAITETSLLAKSSLYHSPPMGPQDQPDYINAVVAIETALSPHALLDALQQIEQKHGRIRKRHWGERTLDLDILLYADKVIEDERLTVPHPGIAERAFVVYPLAEIAPALQIPGHGSLATIKANCPPEGIEPLENKQS
jgi:2-amino-4-hydroxy-6-hydroxymethyldihydropteridine diphosphokinase